LESLNFAYSPTAFAYNARRKIRAGDVSNHGDVSNNDDVTVNENLLDHLYNLKFINLGLMS
jgi:hypothetical protein